MVMTMEVVRVLVEVIGEFSSVLIIVIIFQRLLLYLQLCCIYF